jgi:hypothetical protein
MRTLYKVYETIDEYGRPGSTIGYFTSSSNASTVAEGRGWYGGAGGIVAVNAIVVDDNMCFEVVNSSPLQIDEDLIESRQNKIKKALAKLSEEERNLLGV